MSQHLLERIYIKIGGVTVWTVDHNDVVVSQCNRNINYEECYIEVQSHDFVRVKKDVNLLQ